MTACVSTALTKTTAQSAPPKVLRNATSSTQVRPVKRLTLNIGDYKMNKRQTIEQQFADKIGKCETEAEKLAVCAKFANEIVQIDERLISCSRIRTGYGTWSGRLDFINEYHFGLRLTVILLNVPSIMTHDEEKVFSPSDFEEDIYEELYNHIDDIKSQDDEI